MVSLESSLSACARPRKWRERFSARALILPLCQTCRDNGIFYPRKRGIPVLVRMLKFKTEVKCPKMAAMYSVHQKAALCTVDSYTRLKAVEIFE